MEAGGARGGLGRVRAHRDPTVGGGAALAPVVSGLSLDHGYGLTAAAWVNAAFADRGGEHQHRAAGALEPLIDQLNDLGKPVTSFVLSSPKAWAPVPPPTMSD